MPALDAKRHVLEDLPIRRVRISERNSVKADLALELLQRLGGLGLVEARLPIEDLEDPVAGARGLACLEIDLVEVAQRIGHEGESGEKGQQIARRHPMMKDL